MSKKFMDKFMKATKEKGNAFFTKRAKEQDKSMKEEGSQWKEKGVSLKDRMMNAVWSINETTMKGFQRANKSDKQDKTKVELDDSDDKQKEMRKINWNSLKTNQFDRLKLYLRSTYINKAESEVKQKVEQDMKKLKDKKEENKQKTQEKFTSIQTWKDSLKNVIKNKDSKEKTSESWLGNKMHILEAHMKSIKEMLEKQSKKATGFRFDFISNILQKMYWRVAFLLMLIVFAYGIGSALPRQFRKIWENSKKREEQKQRRKEEEGKSKIEQIKTK